MFRTQPLDWPFFIKKGIQPSDGYSSIVFAAVYADEDYDSEVRALRGDDQKEPNVLPEGFILVLQTNRKNPQWKMAGGKGEEGENPLETALREFIGETNIEATDEQLEYAGCEWMGNHWRIFFRLSLRKSQLATMSREHPGNEHEDPAFFTRPAFDELERSGELFTNHLQVMVRLGFIILAGNRKLGSMETRVSRTEGGGTVRYSAAS